MPSSYETDQVVGWAIDQQVTNAALGPADYDILGDGSYGVATSGSRVSHRTATYLPAVWQVVTQLAGSLSTAPIRLRERDGDVAVDVTNDPRSYAVADQPNPYMQAVKFWKRVWTYYFLWGNAYIYLEWERRGARYYPTLWPLLPDRTQPYYLDGKLVYLTEIRPDEPTLQALTPDRILHLEWFPDACGLQSLDVTREARNAWGLAMARQDFASRFFKRGGRSGGTLVLDGSSSKSTRDQTEKTFRRAYEQPDEWFKTVVFRDGTRFHADNNTFEQTQMVESSRESVKDVARYYNIAPSRLGEEGGTSYGDKTEDNRAYLDMTLAPHMGYVEKECDAKMLTEADRREKRLWFEYNTDRIVRETRKSRYEGHEIAIRSRFMLPNEARVIEGFAPVPGGDRLQNPAIDPAAHIAAISEKAQCAAGVFQQKLARRKTPVDDAWMLDAKRRMVDAVRLPIEAYCSVFGGCADHIATECAHAVLVAPAEQQINDTKAIIKEVLSNARD